MSSIPTVTVVRDMVVLMPIVILFRTVRQRADRLIMDGSLIQASRLEAEIRPICSDSLIAQVLQVRAFMAVALAAQFLASLGHLPRCASCQWRVC